MTKLKENSLAPKRLPTSMNSRLHLAIRPEHVAAAMVVIGIVGLMVIALWTR